jgi:hypothetical protein
MCPNNRHPQGESAADRLIAASHRRKVTVALELLGQQAAEDQGVHQGAVGALPQVGRHRVGGVPDQEHRRTIPVLEPDLTGRPATALLLVRGYVAGTGFEPV